MRSWQLGALIAALVLAPAAARPAAAQTGAADWETEASGDEVLAIAASPSDSRVLWVGTEGGGVVVWDVERGVFDQYVFPTQPGLASNQVRDLAFAPGDDSPWLATAGGVTYAGGSTWDHFGMSDGLPSDDVTAVAVAADGAVYVGTRGDGVAALMPGATGWEAWRRVEDEPELGPAHDEIADLVVGPEGKLWVAHGRAASVDELETAMSVYEPSDGTWSFVREVPPGGDTTAGPATAKLMALDFDEEGRLWAATWGEGVLSFDGASWWTYDEDDGVCHYTTWAVRAVGDTVWAACGDDTKGLGVARRDGASGLWSVITEADGLPTDVVAAIEAADGVAYLGTNGVGTGPAGSNLGHGVVPYDGAPGAPLSTSGPAPATNDITALLVDDRGTLWAGTRGAGLLRRGPDGSWSAFTRASSLGGLAGDTVTALAQRGGDLWVGAAKMTYEGGQWVDGGLSILDLDTLAWATPLRSTTSDLPDDNVGGLAVDASGRVWIGLGTGSGGPGSPNTVNSGRGLAVHDPDAGTWESYKYEDTGGGLVGNTVVAVAASGTTGWAAASYHPDLDGRRTGGGVSRLDGGAWTGWPAGADGFRSFSGSGDPSDVDPFITGDVRSVAVAPDGAVWAGTWDLEAGQLSSSWPRVDAVVNRYDGTAWQSWMFERAGWVSALAVDAAGRAWVGTTRGHNEAYSEYVPWSGGQTDGTAGGVLVWTGAGWTELSPWTSGLTSHAVTALAADPATGAVWVGTENGGLSVWRGAAEPAATPAPATAPPDAPTATAPPGSTAAPPGPTAPPAATPTEPPPDIPEPGTIVLLGAGLAGLAAWTRRRRRALGVDAEAP